MAAKRKTRTLQPVAPKRAAVAIDTELAVGALKEANFELSPLRDKLAWIGDEKLVLVDGVHGLFTPVGKADGTDAGSAQNLSRIIELLKGEVVELRAENLALAARLREAEEKAARTPDDFATAVKHSVDSLATRLSQMQNPISNFVVREFALEAKVQVDVTPLGTIDYRFVRPGDAHDPARLSTLSLKLAPVPKPTSAGSYVAPEFTPQVAVEEIQGVGEVWGKRLNAHGIYTVGDLALAGTRAKSKVELAALLQVDRERLGTWLTQAELMTVRDVDGRGAELLARTGVANLERLAEQEPETLASKYNAENDKKREGKVATVDAATAKRWIDAARTWTGKRAPAVQPPPTAPNG